MTVEQKVLLDLVKSHITGEAFSLSDIPSGVDMSLVINEAKAQSVLLMAVDVASGVEGLLPQEQFKEQYALALMLSLKNAEVERSQKSLTELLNAAGKPYAIIKGEAAAGYYKRPELRTLGDVDFLIDPKDVEELTELFVLNGYKKREEDHVCHVVFKKPKSHLEMHFEIVGIPSGAPGEAVREYMQNALEHTQTRNNGMGDFEALSDPKHGLVILLHMVHHMLTEGIGLRHLCDWAFFVKKTKDKPFWSDELLPILKKIGLLKYAEVMTKTSALYLGIDCPDFAKGINNKLCEEVIEDIFTGGNFGRKDKAYAESGIMVSNHGKDGMKKSKIKNALGVVNDSVKYHHPIAIKVKILYPFFAFYRLLRYFFLILCGKRQSLSKTVPTANKRRDLYSRLNVFEVEE